MKRIFLFFSCVLMFTSITLAQRLPEIAVPENYKVTLTPDLTKGDFTGDEVIQLRVLKPTSNIILNAAAIDFQNVTISVGGVSHKANVTFDKEKEQATIAVPEQLQPGPASLQIHYTGILNDEMRGFYLGKEDNGRKYAATQLEATDARRAFPSFDEPAYKATFDVTVIAQKGMAVISNTKPLSDTAGPSADKHIVRFATTPKMSCYLVAIVVGDFEYVEGSADGIRMRVYTTPGKKNLAAFSLDAAENVMRYYNRYFGIKYPYDKLDLVGLPDFSPGAMENTGCITFRELALLIDDKHAAMDDKKLVATVVAHEIAHQWFGDLVTMQWWNDFWLNEGFATWMSSKPVEAWHPDWHIELSDLRDTSQAMDSDSLENTHPIHQEAHTPGEILELADQITYQKTAAVLRMLETYVGADAFRAGVNAYLKKHAYANATAADFWAAQAKVSKRPVGEIMPTFIEQAGVPLVSMSAKCSGTSEKVSLVQKRYFYNGARLDAGTNERWQIPVCLKTGASNSAAPTKCELLTSKEQDVTLNTCSPWVEVNANAGGYYRSGYDSAALRSIDKDVEMGLSPAERIMLLSDVWSSVRINRNRLSDYLQLAESLQSDRNSNVMGQLIDQLGYIDRYLVRASDRDSYDIWLRQLLNPAAQELGWQGKPGESPDVETLRASLMRGLGYIARDPQVQAEASKLADEALQGSASVNRDLAFEAFPVAAVSGDAGFYDKVMAALKTAKTPEEEYLYQRTLAYFSDPSLLQRTLEYAIGPNVRSQDSLFMVYRVMRNPAGERLAWDFVREHWSDIERLGGPFGSSLMVEGVGLFCDTQMENQVNNFFSTHPVPAAGRTLKQSLERISYCVDLKAQQETQLASWLQQKNNPAGK